MLNSRSGTYIWDEVWSRDEYASQNVQFRRAQHRVDAFGLSDVVVGSDLALLDIGCGSGELLNAIQPDCVLIGLDRSSSAIELAKMRYPASSARYVRGDVQTLPFPNSSIDILVAFGVLEHVRDHRTVLREMRRIMKSSAVALISTSNSRSLLQLANRLLDRAGFYRYGFQKNWTLEDFETELQECFTIRRSFVAHAAFDMPLVACIDRLLARFNFRWGRYNCFVVDRKIEDE